MKFIDKTKDGFTLVEMLVVVLLIAVLAGHVFRMTSMANDRSAKAVTVSRIAKLQAAIEEFYSEYGQYPPVPDYGGKQPMMYEYPSAEQIELSGKANAIKNANRNAKDWKEAWDKAPVFTFGLMSFLLPRYNDLDDEDYVKFGRYEGGAHASKDVFTLDEKFQQWSAQNSLFNRDNERDVEACRRWWPYIQDIVDFRDDRPSTGSSVTGYTNSYATVRDGWDNELIYKSSPPYQTYELYAEHDGKKIEGHAGH